MFGVLRASSSLSYELRRVAAEFLLNVLRFRWFAGVYCKTFSLEMVSFLGETLSVSPQNLSKKLKKCNASGPRGWGCYNWWYQSMHIFIIPLQLWFKRIEVTAYITKGASFFLGSPLLRTPQLKVLVGEQFWDGWPPRKFDDFWGQSSILEAVIGKTRDWEGPKHYIWY